MKRIFILLFGTCVYLLSTASTAYANVENCIRHLEDQAQEIISALEGKGHYYTGICRTESPFLNVVVINLDNTKNEISITHSEKVDEKGYPLRRISKHAEQKGAHIAINGFTWKGATECPPDMSDAELFGMGHQCMHDRGAFVFNQGYASNPTGTVYSEGVKTYQRPDKNESSIGFAERTYEGTNAAFFDVVNMKEVKDDFTHNLDSTRSTIIRDGVAEDFKNCDNPANCNDATSSMGIGQYDDVDVLVLLSSHGLKVANYGDLL